MATALVSALNSHTPSQRGENGHVEHGWSNDLREEIVQLSFQCVRTTELGVSVLGNRLYSIAQRLLNINEETNVETYLYKNNGDRKSDFNDVVAKNEEVNELIDILRRLVVHTRDIEAGKGEYSIGRQFIKEWYRLFPSEALKMIKYYVTPIKKITEEGVTLTHPYGSWKDIKFLWRVFGGVKSPPEVFAFLINLVNTQLREDLKNENPSLVARWVSRENSSKKHTTPFKPFYHALAEDYYNEYLKTARTVESKTRARRKCYTHYRKFVLVPLNKKLRTPQINQCAKRWKNIDYASDVTSITMRKQTQAFMNIKKDGTVRSMEEDRIDAAQNFTTFVNNVVENGGTIKGKRVGFNTVAADAWNLVERHYYPHSHSTKENFETETKVLNLQWESMLEVIGDINDMVPMIDLSGSMVGDPLNAAIGIGAAVASKSLIGKGAMTFSNSPVWMNFEGCNKLSEMIEEMYKYRNEWGGSTNFTAALILILDKCVQLKLPASDVANIKLLILSDMQINSSGNESVSDTMWENITKRYAEAGMRAIGEPYQPGHIIFWNLRHTNGFPTLSTNANTTMFSGFSPVLLNNFAQHGLEALQNTNPFTQLKQELTNPRYNILDFA